MFLGFDRRFRTGYRLIVREDESHYPLWSDGLWGMSPELDSPFFRLKDGIPERHYPGIGWQKNPAYIAWWGLCAREESTRQRAAAWLMKNRHEHKGFTAWHYDFEWMHEGMALKAPWISAMAQGLGASLLFRVGDKTKDEAMHNAAVRSLESYRVSVKDGGVRTTLGGGAYYEEYPTPTPTYVLDGFLFAVLACADLKAWTQDGTLLEEALETLEANLYRWDWRGCWSTYGICGPLCPLEYHQLNIALLQALSTKTASPILRETLRRWSHYRDSRLLRMRIYGAYYLSQTRHTVMKGDGLKAFLRRKQQETAHARQHRRTS